MLRSKGDAMSDTEPVENESEKPEAAKKDIVVKDAEPQTATVVRSTPPWPLITIGIVATVIILAVMAMGWGFVVSHSQSPAMRTQTLGRYGTEYGRNGSDGSLNYGSGGGYRRGRGGSLGNIAASGVVTAINGDTITVSGQGKQVTVKKSSSTTISGDATSVAVNDTVIVLGTTNSDGSVDATRIAIRNGSGGNNSSPNSDNVPGI